MTCGSRSKPLHWSDHSFPLRFWTSTTVSAHVVLVRWSAWRCAGDMSWRIFPVHGDDLSDTCLPESWKSRHEGLMKSTWIGHCLLKKSKRNIHFTSAVHRWVWALDDLLLSFGSLHSEFQIASEEALESQRLPQTSNLEGITYINLWSLLLFATVFFGESWVSSFNDHAVLNFHWNLVAPIPVFFLLF